MFSSPILGSDAPDTGGAAGSVGQAEPAERDAKVRAVRNVAAGQGVVTEDERLLVHLGAQAVQAKRAQRHD